MEKSKLSIEQFITEVRRFFINCQFKSADDVRNFNWTDKSIKEAEKPIVRYFTEGMCYWFAKMLSDEYPGGRMCFWKGHGHIVYYYKDKVYDITGEIKNKRAKYIPIEYFGDLIDEFKHSYIGCTSSKADIIVGYDLAYIHNDIIQVK